MRIALLDSRLYAERWAGCAEKDALASREGRQTERQRQKQGQKQILRCAKDDRKKSKYKSGNKGNGEGVRIWTASCGFGH